MKSWKRAIPMYFWPRTTIFAFLWSYMLSFSVEIDKWLLLIHFSTWVFTQGRRQQVVVWGLVGTMTRALLVESLLKASCASIHQYMTTKTWLSMIIPYMVVNWWFITLCGDNDKVTVHQLFVYSPCLCQVMPVTGKVESTPTPSVTLELG